MFVGRDRVLFSLFVLPRSVVMPHLMMMMRGGGVVGGRLMVVLARWMLRRLCHYVFPPWTKTIPYLEASSLRRR
jgi:hypothetical protein